jgi:UDP-N-acetylglucosamine acyltransferase
MPDVHPTAMVDATVRLADDVSVGPQCILEGDVRIGPGTRLIGRAWLRGPMTLGAGNVVYPNVCLGFAPQSLSFDPQTPGEGLEIGDGNVLREGVTIHRAMTGAGPTRIGNRNFFMTNAHAGHDARLGDDIILASCTMVGGHAEVGDRVNLGGGAGIHQFCRVGRGVMFSGNAGVTLDVPPFFTVTATNVCGSINIIGLRRQGVPREQIDDVRWIYRMLYRRGMSVNRALEALRERSDRPMVREYIEFIETSRRGICPAHGKRTRGFARL